MCLVGANDDSDDANQEGRGKSVWSFCVGGHVGNGYTAYHCDAFTAGSVASSKRIFLLLKALALVNVC